MYKTIFFLGPINFEGEPETTHDSGEEETVCNASEERAVLS